MELLNTSVIYYGTLFSNLYRIQLDQSLDGCNSSQTVSVSSSLTMVFHWYKIQTAICKNVCLGKCHDETGTDKYGDIPSVKFNTEGGKMRETVSDDNCSKIPCILIALLSES